jgi:drug/metabolite transporter (DMT)-like permease
MSPLVPASAIAFAAILWGTWWWPMRLLEAQGLDVAWSSLVIFVTATAFLAPFALARRASMRAGGGLLVAVGASLGVLLVTWNVALVLGDVVRVTLLFYLAPIWATLLARLVLREAIDRMRALSIVMGLAGAAVVLGVPGQAGLPLPRGAGDWLGLGSGLLFALSLTLARLGSHVTEGGATEGLGGFEQTFVAFAVAAAGSLIFAVAQPGPTPSSADIVAGVPLAGAVAIVWLLPQTILILWGAARFDPGRTSILMLLEVIAATVSATIIAGDLLTGRDLAGCALIVAAGATEAASMRRAAGPRPPGGTAAPGG